MNFENFETEFEKSKKTWKTFSTNMNIDSSRSHVVFWISLKNEENKINSTISIIDLAGSENGSMNEDKTWKTESGHINKSLSSLKRILN